MTQQNRSAMIVLATTLWALLWLVLIPVNNLHAAVATARVSLIKVASLRVEAMEIDELYQLEGESRMTSSACLRAGGESMPFRISASSLADLETFAVKSQQSGEHVPYLVTWATGDALYFLKNQRDMTSMLQIGANSNCQYSTLTVEIDNDIYSTAADGTYLDTLSIIFVIE